MDTRYTAPRMNQALNRAPFAIAIAFFAPVAALTFGGYVGLEGFALGFGGATFGVTGLYLVTQLVARSAQAGHPSKKGILIPVLFFLAKIPVYIGLGILANRLGGAGFNCFLAGIVLVYSVVVVGAILPKTGTRNDLSE
jgi:hypothetical protein